MIARATVLEPQRSGDTRTRLAAETCAIVIVTLAAGLQPAWTFAATALTVWTSIVALHWWTELACENE
ncbi:hypothetical protein ACH419_43505 [Streptomyces bobili]|uniref:hypothetical protein n=1 Tax=Streptomyces bobili TaxID=67280 RepID=UPI0037BB277B